MADVSLHFTRGINTPTRTCHLLLLASRCAPSHSIDRQGLRQTCSVQALPKFLHTNHVQGHFLAIAWTAVSWHNPQYSPAGLVYVLRLGYNQFFHDTNYPTSRQIAGVNDI